MAYYIHSLELNLVPRRDACKTRKKQGILTTKHSTGSLGTCRKEEKLGARWVGG